MWTQVRRATFAADWNGGIESDLLASRYGLESPKKVGAIVLWLRRRGVVLKARPRGRGAGARMMAVVNGARRP